MYYNYLSHHLLLIIDRAKLIIKLIFSGFEFFHFKFIFLFLNFLMSQYH